MDEDMFLHEYKDAQIAKSIAGWRRGWSAADQATAAQKNRLKDLIILGKRW